MATQREIIRLAYKAALAGTGVPPSTSVKGRLIRPPTETEIKSALYSVTMFPETVDQDPEVSDSDGVVRICEFGVVVIVKLDPNDEDPAARLDEHLSWIERAVLADPSMGGTARWTALTGTDEPELGQLNFAAIGAIVRFETTYFTAWNNPEVT